MRTRQPPSCPAAARAARARASRACRRRAARAPRRVVPRRARARARRRRRAPRATSQLVVAVLAPRADAQHEVDLGPASTLTPPPARRAGRLGRERLGARPGSTPAARTPPRPRRGSRQPASASALASVLRRWANAACTDARCAGQSAASSGPGRPAAEGHERGVDVRLRHEDRARDGVAPGPLEREGDSTLGPPYAVPRAGAEALGDLALHHHAPAFAAPGRPRIESSTSGVATL